MSLASNQKLQMAKRLQQDLQLLAPEYTHNLLTDPADGAPYIQSLDSSSNSVAIMAIKDKQFSGFNIVAELSSSAGNGYPEKDLFLCLKDATPLLESVKLTKAAVAAGCASLKLVDTGSNAPAITNAVDAQVTVEIPNDARVGFSGN